MKHIDRLMIRAKEIANRCTQKFVLAFIYPDGDMWVADGRLWNGKPGSGVTSTTFECRTIDEAVGTLNQLEESHPNVKPETIIIDDLEE